MAYSNYPSNIMGYPKTSIPDTYSDVILSGQLKNSGIATTNIPIAPSNYYAYSSAATRVQIGNNVYSVPANTLTKIPITSVSTQQPFLSISDSTITTSTISGQLSQNDYINNWVYGNNVFYGTSLGNSISFAEVSSDALYSTTISVPNENTYTLTSVDFVNQTWIRGAYNYGTSFTYSTSKDLINWNTLFFGTSIKWGPTAIAYGNGIYVIVGSSFTSASQTTQNFFSTDLISFTSSANLPAQAYWTSVAYGNSNFVAVSYGKNGFSNTSNVAATSTNGITWTSRTIPAGNYQKVIYANGLFVASTSADGSASSLYSTSTDGITWTARTLPSSIYQTGVQYGNGLYLIANFGNTSSYVYYSTDAVTWTLGSRSLSGRYIGANVAYGNGVFAFHGDAQDSRYVSVIKTVNAPSTPIDFAIYSGPKDVY